MRSLKLTVTGPWQMTHWAGKGTVSLYGSGLIEADCWGSSPTKRTLFQRVRGPREEEAACTWDVPTGEPQRSQGRDPGVKQSIQKEDSASAIRHVQGG